jgi:peroxiredoxin/uncharacterized membrane protein YphA (DoxX/SURF4 family)
MNSVLLLARLLLSATFALAGISKLADRAGTRQSILDFGVPAFLASPLVVLLPLLELLCAAALLPASSSLWGAAGTLMLLLAFIAGISVNLVRGRRPDCHCFGQLHSSPVGWKTLTRNSALSGMAALVVWQGRENPAPSYLRWFVSLSSSEIAALSILVLAFLWAWSLFHLLRQNGRLLLRLEAVEAKLGLDVPAPPGLPLDSPAPFFRLNTIDEGVVSLDSLRASHDNLLLIFTEPQCEPCEALLPDVAQWQREFAGRLSVVLISRGSEEDNRAKALRHNLRNILLQPARETAEAYRAEATPSAVFVKAGKIASPVSVGADSIRELVAAAAALTPGETVPELAFPDLNGQRVNFQDLRDRHTLIMFWNPSCGFCQEMLEDVKTWERNAAPDAPRLLVISTGDVETNRAQGFRAPVLLDQKFEAGRLFGADGTPAAVMLDPQGRVASKVGVGAADVLSLTRWSRNGALK